MTHVLVDGDIRRHPVLRSLLRQWNVTVGSMSEVRRTGEVATVDDCDAVISCGPRTLPVPDGFCAMPDGAGTEGAVAVAAAPLLVIGLGPDLPRSWISIPEIGPGGAHLKTALRSCEERARMLREDPGARHDRGQFRDFLGHELRTPLTSLKTALSVLDAESEADPGSARMIRIALRNLARLEETVEWSQELRSLADSPPTAELVPTDPASLKNSLADHLEVQLDEETGSCEILTDLRLLGTLAVQMERVLFHACPGCRPQFRMVVDTAADECRLTATAAPLGSGDGRESEWDHLARMLISPHLLKVLGVRLRVRKAEGGAPFLTAGMPLAPVYEPARPDLCPAV